MPHDRLDLTRLDGDSQLRATESAILSQAEMARLIARGRRLHGEALRRAFATAYATVAGFLHRPFVGQGRGAPCAEC
jgi:hypothetical protein